MVAMGVLAVGIGGVLAMFMGASAAHRGSLDETTAAMVGEGALAEYRAEFNASGIKDPLPVDKAPADGFPFFFYSVRPTVLEREPGTLRALQVYVEVEVGWQRQGRPRTIIYRSILFRE
jgi:hypothetical protein